MVPQTFLVSLLAILQQASSQTGVCSQVVSSLQNYQVYVSVSSGYTTACGLFWLFRCSETRYRAVTQLRTRVIYNTEPVCCSGYTGDGIKCNPVCDNCNHPGVCVAPGVCECPVGWTGDQCSEDIDECQSGICDYCTNTVGSFECMCPDNSTLPSGQFSCIDAPQMLSVNTVNSTSLLVSWEAPSLDETDGSLQNYSVTCSEDNSEGTPLTIYPPISSVGVLNLMPYTTYTCCIYAQTTTGISGVSCLTETTLEDVPSGPPESILVAAVSPFAIEIEWSHPNTSNGIITYYSVYSNNTLVVSVDGSQRNYLYHSLSPYKQVSVCVSASTTIGEGPKSDEISVQTLESAPGIIKLLVVDALNDSVLHISWEPPLSRNGVLTGYQVTVTNLLTNVRLVQDVEHDVLAITVSDGIEPYVPFYISVTASTAVGVGEAQQTVAFTREEVPVVSPVLAVSRTGATSALIEWELLSLEQLRGNLTSYEIVYFELVEECHQNSTSKNSGNVSVEAIRPVFSLTGFLDPGKQYCVGIAARTGAGVGPFNYEAVSWYHNSMFSIVIEVTSCLQWIEESPADKMEELVLEISSGIKQYCQCDFSSDFIFDTTFLCGQNNLENVVFQGQIISADDRDSASLVQDLEQWASDEPVVMIQGERLQVVSSGESETTTGVSTSEEAPWTAIGVSVAVVILLVVAALSIIIASVFYCKRPKGRKNESYETVAAVTPTTDDSTCVLKDLNNPFYGYGAKGNSEMDPDTEYSEIHKQPNTIANPAYGTTPTKKLTERDIVANPLYVEAPQETDEVDVSTSGLYTEIPVSGDVCIYETPTN